MLGLEFCEGEAVLETTCNLEWRSVSQRGFPRGEERKIENCEENNNVIN
jgi:hypothetical protein